TQDDQTTSGLPSLAHNAQAPEMISIGPFIPAGSSDIGLVVREENQVMLQSSPVEFGLFWGYAPATGRLAYSSEFWAAPGDGSNVSVSDLWVYDYVSGQSQQWVEANVGYARWALDGQRLAAAIWNSGQQRFDLALVSGPGEVAIVAECTSVQFEWNPWGDQLAFANLAGWAGTRSECQGTYVVSFEDGMDPDAASTRKVNAFGAQGQMNGSLNDRPIWALGEEALIILDSPFWIVPMDGSPAYVPTMPGGEEPLNMPRLVNPLWVPELRQLIGFVETGMNRDGGVYVYQFSEDMQSVTSVMNIESALADPNADLTLIDWWEPGKSLLLLDHNMALENQFLSEYWGKPVIWSLTDQAFIPIP
ncbi:MAG: hypothetical protein PVG63_08780, partial [Anaerolineales bacterium]